VAVRSMAQTPYQHSITSAAEGMQRHSSITVIADGRGSVPQDTPPTLAVKAGDKATEAPGAPGAPSDPQAAAAAARTQSAFPVLGPGMMHHPGISQRQLLFRGLRLRQVTPLATSSFIMTALLTHKHLCKVLAVVARMWCTSAACGVPRREGGRAS
jgi:hypothetical protein